MVNSRRLFWIAALGAAMLLFAGTAVAADAKVVWVAAKTLVSVDGDDLFGSHCAACHGAMGKGNGPAVARLERAVPDLTLVTLRDGSFSIEHILASHLQKVRSDQKGMPEIHRVLVGAYGRESVARLAEVNLVRYVEGLQSQPTIAADK
jgi:mono/diheme cytochrome c family protein